MLQIGHKSILLGVGSTIFIMSEWGQENYVHVCRILVMYMYMALTV